MDVKSELIVKDLGAYKERAITYIEEYIEESKNYIISVHDKLSGCPSEKIIPLKSLIYLGRNQIYPYIKNNRILYDKFLERACYYNRLNNNTEFKKLLYELSNDIKNLYSLVDEDEALSLEQENNYYFFSICNKAIESLKFGMEQSKDYYSKLIDMIKEDSNYYTLDFNQDCHDFYKGKNSGLFDFDEILNIHKIIFQYKALKEPVSYESINKFPTLIPEENMNKFESIKLVYENNINKLEELLKKDFDSKKLYAFYLFNKFINCGNNCKLSLERDELFKCLDCCVSITVVLDELINFVAETHILMSKEEYLNLKIKVANDLLNEENYMQDTVSRLKKLLTPEEFNAIEAVSKHKNQEEAAKALNKKASTIIKQLANAREKVAKSFNRTKISTIDLCNMINSNKQNKYTNF